MAQQPRSGRRRMIENLREHYEIEKELADRLRRAPKEQRRRLYCSLYDELFRRVPRHPQLTRKTSPQETAQVVGWQMRFLRRFLTPECTFLEIGPGDCALSVEVARLVKQVYAVDVSAEIVRRAAQPANFRLVLSDGSSVPVPPNSVDVAYSNQLMEHLHPEDAFEQLQNVYASLTAGGVYVCITPNRLNGPHDISMYFDEVATGFHLKEYTTRELNRLFRKVGFLRVRAYVGGKGRYAGVPVLPICWCEMLLDRFPHVLRRAVARSSPFRALLGIRLVGTK